MLSFKANFDDAYRGLSDLARKQLPYATAMALNDTAQDVKSAEEADIENEFENPTPFTKRALYLRRASKSRLTSEVGVKRVQAGYLKRQVTGGVRRPAGRALLVPGSIRLNKYGNMPKGAVKRMLARPNTFVASKKKSATRHMRPGIYQRKGSARRGTAGVKLLVAFEARASYQKRWNFRGIAIRKGRGTFEGHYLRWVKRAIATKK